MSKRVPFIQVMPRRRRVGARWALSVYYSHPDGTAVLADDTRWSYVEALVLKTPTTYITVRIRKRERK